MGTHGQLSFETATPMPHASGRSPRGGDRYVVQTTPLRVPVCGVFRVDFQHPEFHTWYLVLAFGS